MNTSRLPQTQAPSGHVPLIDHVPAHPAGQDALYSNYNEHTWRNTLGQADHSAARVQLNTRRSLGRGLVNNVPSTARGQPALYSDRDTTGWQRHQKTARTRPLPGPPDPQGSVTFNSVGLPTFNAQEWREEQRARNTPVAPLNAAEANNSEQDQEDRRRMGLPQQFERRFRRTSSHISSIPILGFGSMNLAIWEQILLLFALALPNGSTAGILTTFLFTALGYCFITTSLADMARRYPTYAGPFYWTIALQTSQTTSSLSHQMSWLCAWMSVFGLGINLVVNMIYISDVTIFLFTLASKWFKFVYLPQKPKKLP